MTPAKPPSRNKNSPEADAQVATTPQPSAAQPSAAAPPAASPSAAPRRTAPRRTTPRKTTPGKPAPAEVAAAEVPAPLSALLSAAGYTLVLTDTDNDSDTERRQVEQLRARGTDGFIIDRKSTRLNSSHANI